MHRIILLLLLGACETPPPVDLVDRDTDPFERDTETMELGTEASEFDTDHMDADTDTEAPDVDTDIADPDTDVDSDTGPEEPPEECINGVVSGALCVCDGGWYEQACDSDIRVAFVDRSAPPDGDGHSWETAFRDVADAMRTDAPRIYVRGSIPRIGDTPVVTMRANTHLVGGFSFDLIGNQTERQPGSRSRLNGQSRPPQVVVMADNTTLEGFEVTGGRNRETGFDHTAGGGITIQGVSNVNLIDLSVHHNHLQPSVLSYTTRPSGGGIGCFDSTDVSITNTQVWFNRAIGSNDPFPNAGGGIGWLECTGSWAHVSVTSNAAELHGGGAQGGGIHVVDSSLEVHDLILAGNTVSGTFFGSPLHAVADNRGAGAFIHTVTSTEPWTEVVVENNSANGTRGWECVPETSNCYSQTGSFGVAGGVSITNTDIPWSSSAVINNRAVGNPLLSPYTPNTLPGQHGGIEGFIEWVDYLPEDLSGNTPNAMTPCPVGWSGDHCDVPGP